MPTESASNMLSFIDVGTFVCSVVIATLISLLTFIVEIRKYKRDLVLQAITANRINWIAEVRTLLTRFLHIYMDGSVGTANTNELKKLLVELRLYFHNQLYSNDYNDFFDCLKKCCNEPYSPDNENALIEAAQGVLKRAWVRLKIEGGQNKQADEKIRKAVQEYIEQDEKIK